ncbi:MAG: putative zinc-binding metallopeptidase [Bdellovibrionales bacterium]|nr:putative zinc-binding metallopeptidase [Bdellovibrionales bacterium]
MQNLKKLSKLDKLERQILLQLPLSRLPLKRHNPLIEKAYAQLKKELSRKGIHFVPHIWISSEWFCPDGIPGFAIPFYLYHPTLQKMEKEKIGVVEGANYSELLKLMRHETGHAFENYYSTRKHPLRRKVFGCSQTKPYPASYKPVLYSTQYVSHLGEGYAQSHPDEDFAETFAAWLSMPKKVWSIKYRQKKVVLKKLEAIENIVFEVKNRKQANKKNNKTFEIIDKDHRLLKDYYSEKLKRQKLSTSLETKKLIQSKGILKNYVKNEKEIYRVLSRNRNKILNELSHNLGLYKYQAKKLIKPLEKDFKLINKTLLASEEDIYQFILDTAVVEALESVRLKKDRVYL